MDLQRLVEQRIAELQALTGSIKDDSPPDFHQERSGSVATLSACEEDLLDKDYRDMRPRRERPATRQTRATTDVKQFCVMVDAALADVVGRIMEITERVTEDHARIEKDLLDLRLETLESAESVIDMALALREKARRMAAVTGNGGQASRTPGRRGFPVDSEEIDSKVSTAIRDRHEELRSRASMHDVGVAALFRKTHQE